MAVDETTDTVELSQLPHWREVEWRDGYRSKGDRVACENCGATFPTTDFQRLLHLIAYHRNVDCKTPEAPEHCAQVDYVDHRGEGYEDRPYTANVGDLVWDPKMGEGHIIAGTVTCGKDRNYCGYCGGMGEDHEYLVCMCGGFDVCDHHGFVLARR